MSDPDAMTDGQFRVHVRGWIKANHPPELRNSPQCLHFKDNNPWYRKLAQRGWLCPSWPKEFGGMGISASKQRIFLATTGETLVRSMVAASSIRPGCFCNPGPRSSMPAPMKSNATFWPGTC
jgi:alkylation response protein AidB-like acyl-CoA dehydrogenase